jgi:hypothetical protein
MTSPSRILTTHVGSLIRPPDLVELLSHQNSGETVAREALAACIDRGVHEVVRKQAAVGVDIVSDGEFGKPISWSHYISNRLVGVEPRPDVEPEHLQWIFNTKDRRDFAEFYNEYERELGVAGMGQAAVTGPRRRMAVVDKLTYKPEAVRADIQLLRRETGQKTELPCWSLRPDSRICARESDVQSAVLGGFGWLQMESSSHLTRS